MGAGWLTWIVTFLHCPFLRSSINQGPRCGSGQSHRMRSEHGVYHVLQVSQQEPVAQKSPHSVLVLPNRLHARSNIHPDLAGYVVV